MEIPNAASLSPISEPTRAVAELYKIPALVLVSSAGQVQAPNHPSTQQSLRWIWPRLVPRRASSKRVRSCPGFHDETPEATMEGTCDEMLTLAEASCHFAHPTSRGARLTYLVKPRCYTCSLFLPALTTSRLSPTTIVDCLGVAVGPRRGQQNCVFSPLQIRSKCQQRQ